MPLDDANVRALRGAKVLDSRIIPADFDWRAYDSAPERHKVKPASEYQQAVIDGFYKDDGTAGSYWPWDKANDHGLRFRPAEITVYSGVNGHRKSMVTGQIMLHQMRQDEPVLVMSFEMRVVKTLMRMMRQSAGTSQPAINYIKAWHQWSVNKLWLYDHLGICGPKQTVAIARYAVQELGVKHVLIDSMMKVIAAPDDYTGQKQFIGDLAALALANACHVHIVTHARKGKSEKDVIDKWDVKGAGEISDQADNLVLVSKNMDKTADDFGLARFDFGLTSVLTSEAFRVYVLSVSVSVSLTFPPTFPGTFPLIPLCFCLLFCVLSETSSDLNWYRFQSLRTIIPSSFNVAKPRCISVGNVPSNVPERNHRMPRVRRSLKSRGQVKVPPLNKLRFSKR